MKFEQLIKIYWSKGFLYGNQTQPFQITLQEFFENKPGIANKSINKFIKRFEFHYYTLLKNKDKTFTDFTKLNKRKIINIYLSKLTSINYDISEVIRYNFIRLYLIKTFRGRCHALGKPSRGQRTWSNAKNAKICNFITRNFIKKVKKFNFIEKKKETLNLKFIKIKKKVITPKIKMIFTKKKNNIWF